MIANITRIVAAVLALVMFALFFFAPPALLSDAGEESAMLPPCDVDEGLPFIDDDEVTCYWGMSEDIVELASFFIAQFSKSLGMPALELTEHTLLKLRRYDWPGNVRELRNLIERSVILGEFPEEFAGHGGGTIGDAAIENLDLVAQRHIMHILDQCNGNRAEAARRLGVSRKTIDRKIAVWSDS